MLHCFGEFELDEDSFELIRDGNPVLVQAKVLDVLIYLVQQRGRLVTKDELLRNLWRNVTVSDASLARAIMGARRALQDESANPRWITTVRGRGYRFSNEGVSSFARNGAHSGAQQAAPKAPAHPQTSPPPQENPDDCQSISDLVMRSS
jgi:DNA-binding winged helix-turn-helix (wHTH) protein